MTVYVTNAEYRRQKTALTRAINSRVPVQVLKTCEKTLGEWNGKAWPDAWSRWARAVEDAFHAFVQSDAGADDRDLNDEKITRRFRECIRSF